jgi:hypothetical protein
MNRLGLLILSSATLAACGGSGPSSPTMEAGSLRAPAFAKAAQPVYTCASADAMLGSLITLVQHATHVQAPAVEPTLLAPLRDAHTALVAKPCNKQGALASMRSFNAAVDASATALSAAQVVMFHSLANRIISSVSLVP